MDGVKEVSIQDTVDAGCAKSAVALNTVGPPIIRDGHCPAGLTRHDMVKLILRKE